VVPRKGLSVEHRKLSRFNSLWLPAISLLYQPIVPEVYTFASCTLIDSPHCLSIGTLCSYYEQV
jgi:hypothetical protein